ncbi:hypothetical protein P9112_008347 [Eukaryota sp. TZLM1-RC]
MTFDFHNPTKYVLGNKVGTIGEEISSRGFQKALIHFGSGSIFKNGCYDTVVESLNKHSVEFVEVGGVQPNPEISLVRKTIKKYHEQGCDCVLAVG